MRRSLETPENFADRVFDFVGLWPEEIPAFTSRRNRHTGDCQGPILIAKPGVALVGVHRGQDGKWTDHPESVVLIGDAESLQEIHAGKAGTTAYSPALNFAALEEVTA